MTMPRHKFVDNYVRINSLSKNLLKDINSKLKKDPKFEYDEEIDEAIRNIIRLSIDSRIAKYEIDKIYDEMYSSKIVRELVLHISSIESIIHSFSKNKKIEASFIPLLENVLKSMETSLSESNYTFLDLDYDCTVYSESRRIDMLSPEKREEYDSILELEGYSYKTILEMIKPVDRNINVLSVEYGASNNFRKAFNNSNHDATLYGVEGIRSLYYDNKHNFDKTAHGFGGRISNKVFDIVFAKPFISSSVPRQSSKSVIRNTLGNMTNYVRNDGVMVLTIPAYRLYNDVLLDISKTMEDITVIYTPSLEDDYEAHSIYSSDAIDLFSFMKRSYITIVGYRSFGRDVNQKDFELLTEIKRLYSVDKEYITTLRNYDINKYELDSFEEEIAYFRGLNIDEEEIANVALEAGFLDEVLDDIKQEGADNSVQPLLPFTLGQIGLVLTSGKLDGVISRNGIDHHVIKGRVIKDMVVNHDVVDSRESKTELIRTNRVEITMFDKEGNYRKLV